jgi:hypothetical protein
MNVYTIVLERIGTGEPLLSIVTRQNSEEAACLRGGGNGAITGPAGRRYLGPTV